MAKLTMRQNATNKPIEEAFEQFLKYCKIKNLSEQTIVYYGETFNKFTGYFGDGQLTNSITNDTVDDYILHLRDLGTLSQISINTNIRGMRAILYYFMDLGFMDKFKIIIPKAEKKVKEAYTDAELELLLAKPDVKKCRFTDLRDWALINYLLATGNRISTATNLKIGDLDFDNGYITLTRTKSKRQQIIPMSSALQEVLTLYIQYRQGTDDDYLFPNQWGSQINVDGLKQAVRRYNQSRGVMKTSCHLFRNTFAKSYILAGGDMFRLQKILGHSTLDMVRQYVDMYASDLQKNFDTFNPLDQLKHKKDPIIVNNHSSSHKRKR